MEAILIGIYSFFVWLIFIKFKWLPWNTKSQVIVVIIPIVAITALILTLNVVAPSSPDVRVIKYVVQVIPQVRGRVIEVPVTGNDYVKKGTVLFKIDPTPYRNTVKQLEGKLAANQAALNEALAGLSQAGASVGEMREAVNAAAGQAGATRANLDLAKKRVVEYRELVATGAGDRFGLEKWEANVRELEGQLAAAIGFRIAGETEIVGTFRRRSGGGSPGQGQGGDGQSPGSGHPGRSRQCPLGIDANRDGGADRRLGDEPSVASRLICCGRALCAGHDLRRG